jgi:hypothetical protein
MQPKLARILFKLQEYIVSYYSNIVPSTVTLGVSQPSPQTEISTRDLEGVVALTGTMNNHTFPHHSIMKSRWWEWRKFLAFPSWFFFRVVAPLYLEELDCFMRRDTTFLIQDLDWVLGVQVSLEWCHLRQHDIHRCIQTFLQLRHMEDVVNSS